MARRRRKIFTIVGTCLCTVGGVLLIIKKLKSIEAKYLQSAVKIESLSGMVLCILPAS